LPCNKAKKKGKKDWEINQVVLVHVYQTLFKSKKKKKKKKNFFLYFPERGGGGIFFFFFWGRGGGGGGVLRISSDGDDRKIFLGLKFSIPGVFWVEEFGKYSLVCGLI